MSRPTLEFTVTGASLSGMLADARATAEEFFGDIPFRLAAFPVHVDSETSTIGGADVQRTFAADAVYEVALAPRLAPGAPTPYVDPGRMFDPVPGTGDDL